MSNPIEYHATCRAADEPILPARWLFWAELPRLALACASLPLHIARLRSAPRGDGRPILVIPGFGAGDGSTALLRSYLRWLGYRPMGWGLGRNLGAATIGQHNEILIERLDRLYQDVGGKITLIGWSMGGIIARMVARERVDAVERIVLLAAPITGNPYSNHGWHAYERISGHSLSHPVARAQIRRSKLPMPVPSTSLYSKSDGVVHWECCLEPQTRHSRNIEVVSSHCGFAFDPKVLRTIADCLADPA